VFLLWSNFEWGRVSDVITQCRWWGRREWIRHCVLILKDLVMATSKWVVNIGFRAWVTLVWVHTKACGVVLDRLSISGLCNGCRVWALQARILVTRGDVCPRGIQIAAIVLTVIWGVDVGTHGRRGNGISGVRRLSRIFCGCIIVVPSIHFVVWLKIRRKIWLVTWVIGGGGPSWARIRMRHDTSFDRVQPKRSWGGRDENPHRWM
jgi:hypothetical protein